MDIEKIKTFVQQLIAALAHMAAAAILVIVQAYMDRLVMRYA